MIKPTRILLTCLAFAFPVAARSQARRVRESEGVVRVGEAGLTAAVAYAALFQLQIEIFDGMYKKYGFSYADMIANTTGQTLTPRFRGVSWYR